MFIVVMAVSTGKLDVNAKYSNKLVKCAPLPVQKTQQVQYLGYLQML